MTNPLQLEILDLRHFNARQLRPLLEQEAASWITRLRWDYRSSTELLLQYLDSRILPGYVAMERGRITGFCFCVYEGQKAVIGDVYAAPGPHNLFPPTVVVDTLIRHLLELLNGSPDILRIEAQLLLFDQGVLPPLFQANLQRGRTLNTYPRLFLECDLALAGPVDRLEIPDDVELCRWSPSFYQPAAELIQRSYVGHPDADINDQYRTLAGSERFLHNIIRFPGCGTFDADSSLVLRKRSTNGLIAILLCSRVSEDTAHVTQLCVPPGYRGRRLGEALLRLSLYQLPSRNYQALTLTVSEANVGAVRLYRATGFRTRHSFDALVIEKANR
jgi:ribosomal protein S18 acetylase RimI-like enzyme